MFSKAPFKGGLDLKFFENTLFESTEQIPIDQHSLILARNALRLLMMGWIESWTELISWPIFKAIFIQRDPALLKALRFAFQQGFESLHNQLQGLDLTEEQKEQVQLYLSNCLSLLPYSDLTPYESIKIPQCVDDQWVLVDYHVKPIELSPSKGVRHYFIKDKDRVFAYGLEPINCPNAESHLIFMGTTYPAGQGFVPQIHTDFEGFDTAGNSLYKNSRKRIHAWLAKQNGKVHVCGVSLGGSLSLLLAIDQGQSLSRVDALNPPGLHDPWYKNKWDNWDSLAVKPKVVIQQQADDPVSIFGVWKKEWTIVHVIPPKEKQGPNLFFDHFLNYAGFADTEFHLVDAEQENVKRGYRNFWLFTLGRNIVYYGAIAPYSYFIRPSLNFFKGYLENKTIALITFICLSALLILIPLGVLAPIYLLVSGLVALTLGCSLAVFPLMLSKLKYQEDINKEDNAEEELANAKLHDPDLPRNATMDIYNPDNAIDLALTQTEVYTYYKVMRCLVKNKKLIPDEDKEFKHCKGRSKREVLLASQDPENQNLPITLKITKAKAIHMRHTLNLVDRIGLEHEGELKRALEQEYEHYRLGKSAGFS